MRNWLATALNGSVLLPSAAKIATRYQAFLLDLPRLSARFHLDPNDLQFVELRTLGEEWVDQNRP